MKTLPKFITTITIASCFFLSCKKEVGKIEPTAPFTSNVEMAGSTKIYLKQKMFNLTPEQTNNIVMKFQKNAQVQNRTTDLVEADSVMLDSAVFLIEAALNFDFDDRWENPDIFPDADKVIYTLNYNLANSKVKSSDLDAAYAEMNSQISELVTSTYKILVVDINAYLNSDGTKVTFEANVSKASSSASACGRSVSGNSSPYLQKYQQLIAGYSITQDAPLLINKQITCSILYPNSCEPHFPYFTNIWNPNPNPWLGSSLLDIPTWVGGPNVPSPKPPFIFSTGASNYSYLGSQTAITPQQLNAFAAACKTEINNRIPTTPSNMVVITGWVDKQWQPLSCSCGAAVYWNLRAKYGTQNCRPISGN